MVTYLKAEFLSLNWIKGTPRHLVQGVKGGNRPRRALYGGNGSFVVMGTPSQLILTVKRIDNGEIVENNILHELMDSTNRYRMSEKFYDTLIEICKKTDFEVSNSEKIDISSILEQL